jgi:hypothetical protein
VSTLTSADPSVTTSGTAPAAGAIAAAVAIAAARAQTTFTPSPSNADWRCVKRLARRYPRTTTVCGLPFLQPR